MKKDKTVIYVVDFVNKQVVMREEVNNRSKKSVAVLEKVMCEVEKLFNSKEKVVARAS